MTRSRRLCILTFLDSHHRWPGFATAAEREEITTSGFAFTEGNEVHLTSLGELETGYPKAPENASDLTQNQTR